MTKVTFSDLLIYMYSTLVTMVTLTPAVSTPNLVGQLRSYTFLWYQEILSVGGGGGVQRNVSPDAEGWKIVF